MPKDKVTSWKRIGRSGSTIDGREIEPFSLKEVAETYNPTEAHTALIWYEHFRGVNLGKVLKLQARDNNEGGVDLYAKIQANEFYLDLNLRGQKLFTSMELMPNYRKKGHYYLSGLAATDSPASAATTEMRFSAMTSSLSDDSFFSDLKDPKDMFFGDFIEALEYSEPEEDKPPRWFTNFFNKKITPDEDDMSKEAVQKLSEELKALTAKVELLSADNPPAGDANADAESDADKFEALSNQVAALTALIKKDEDNAGVDAKAFAALQTSLTSLTEKFAAAMKEQPGTPTPESDGNASDDFKAEDHY